MKFYSTFIKAAVVFSLIFISCKSAEVIPKESDSGSLQNVQEEITGLIINTPAEHNHEEIWVDEQLVDLGGDAVRVLSELLIDPALGSDLQARYALSSLANYVARPGATSEKRTFESALLSEIQKDHSLEVKSFLMEQLRLTASDSSVPTMESFLSNERLYNDALRVLLTLDSPMAVNSIRQSLPASEGKQQIALVKALGELQDRDSVVRINEYAGSDDWSLARMSLFALSKIGQPGSSLLFEQAIYESSGFRKSEIISFYLDYADALANSGYALESKDITDYFLYGEFPIHIKSSALQIRFDVEGAGISNELINIAQESEDILSKSALRLLNELEGESITLSLIDGLEASAENNTIYFIEALGERGDRSAVPVLKNQIESSKSDIRLAAISALYHIEGEIEPEVLIDVLEKAKLDQEVQQIEQLMLQLEPNKMITVAATSIQQVSNSTKPVLIHLLAKYKAEDKKKTVLNEWNSENTEVNVAVADYLGVSGDAAAANLLVDRLAENISDDEQESIQEALASLLNRTMTETQRNQRFYDYYNNGSNLQKERLIHLIPYIDGFDHIEILETSLRHSNSNVRTAAVEVISSWNSSDIIPLFTLALSNIPNESQMALINNFTQTINDSDKSLSDKEHFIHQLFLSIEEDPYRIELLREISERNNLLALQTINKYFDHEDEEIREVSIHKLSEILEPYYSEESGELNVSNGVLAMLDEKVREQVKNQILQTRINQIENEKDFQAEQKPHFGILFNGNDLDGWQVIGNQDAWGVEDGILFTDGAGSGWISTESQYDNFIIELEYRVPVGGNSGLFLRAPHEGNPAYEGLEIQILDDYADQYAELKPWQYTGSIYFEQAVSKRVTKPAGEWQSMKVRAEGPIIQVSLNGEQIINANLIQYMKNAPNHPGLLKRSGYIGLQNHGDRVDFRNISISRID